MSAAILITPVKVYESTYLVDESLSLDEMERGEPEFFRTKFGKRETLTVYRGCLVVRYTRLYSEGVTDRVTVAYLWGRTDDDGLSSFCIGHTANARAAKRMIDDALDTGIARK